MLGDRLKKAVKKTTKKKVVKEVKVTSGSVAVYDGDRFVREYSSEVHGGDYKKLAEQFADKNNYNVK